MAEPVELPQMGPAQQQSWLALLDLYEKVNSEWTLIGGQLVHLHCAERGGSPARPTNDADTVVDIRASPQMLARFTGAMQELGFTPETSGDGIQHRWRRDLAQIDVLIPEGVGERAAARVGAGGAPTISAPGTTQALRRSESLAVKVGDRTRGLSLGQALSVLSSARPPLGPRSPPTEQCLGTVSTSWRWHTSFRLKTSVSPT